MAEYLPDMGEDPGLFPKTTTTTKKKKTIAAKYVIWHVLYVL